MSASGDTGMRQCRRPSTPDACAIRAPRSEGWRRRTGGRRVKDRPARRERQAHPPRRFRAFAPLGGARWSDRRAAPPRGVGDTRRHAETGGRARRARCTIRRPPSLAGWAVRHGCRRNNPGSVRDRADGASDVIGGRGHAPRIILAAQALATGGEKDGSREPRAKVKLDRRLWPFGMWRVLSCHTCQPTSRWCRCPPNRPDPTLPSLSKGENIWQVMRGDWLSHRVFTSCKDILDHCCFAWNRLIDQPWEIMSIGLRDGACRF